MWFFVLVCLLTPADTRPDPKVTAYLNDSFLGRVLTLKQPSLKSEIVIASHNVSSEKKVPPPAIAAALRVKAIEVGDTWVKLKGKRVILVGKELKGLVDSNETVTVKLVLDGTPTVELVEAAIEAAFLNATDFKMLRENYFVDISGPKGAEITGRFKDGRAVYRPIGRVDPPLPTNTFTPPGVYRKDAKQAARVVAWIVVNENGFPEILEIKETTNSDDSLYALKELANWRFSPTKLDGKRIAVATQITLDWRNWW